MFIKFLGVKWPVQGVYEAQKRKNANPLLQKQIISGIRFTNSMYAIRKHIIMNKIM